MCVRVCVCACACACVCDEKCVSVGICELPELLQDGAP